MIQTKQAENYIQGTQQKQGVLYVNTDLVSFLLNSNGIVVYLNIGVVNTETIEDPSTEVTTLVTLDTKVLSYSEDEMKALIEATGQDFNVPVTNLLISEMNKFSDQIVLNDISENPQDYFGLTSDKWEISQPI